MDNRFYKKYRIEPLDIPAGSMNCYIIPLDFGIYGLEHPDCIRFKVDNREYSPVGIGSNGMIIMDEGHWVVYPLNNYFNKPRVIGTFNAKQEEMLLYYAQVNYKRDEFWRGQRLGVSPPDIVIDNFIEYCINDRIPKNQAFKEIKMAIESCCRNYMDSKYYISVERNPNNDYIILKHNNSVITVSEIFDVLKPLCEYRE